jgi:hypothetical protein
LRADFSACPPQPFALGVFSAIEKGACMDLKGLYAGCILAGFIPFLLLTGIVGHFCLARLGRRRRQGPNRRRSRLPAYGLALGMAFVQLMRVFYQPDMAYVLAAAEDEVADEDDSGDPETPGSRLRHFHRQLRRIRRGEPIDRLVLRI